MKNNQWNNVIQANLSSNFTIIKNLLPNMIKNKSGKIIGISSVVATSGNPGQANYVAAKSGMIGFYKSVALEVASRNINITGIATLNQGITTNFNITGVSTINQLQSTNLHVSGISTFVGLATCGVLTAYNSISVGGTDILSELSGKTSIGLAIALG